MQCAHVRISWEKSVEISKPFENLFRSKYPSRWIFFRFNRCAIYSCARFEGVRNIYSIQWRKNEWILQDMTVKVLDQNIFYLFWHITLGKVVLTYQYSFHKNYNLLFFARNMMYPYFIAKKVFWRNHYPHFFMYSKLEKWKIEVNRRWKSFNISRSSFQ